MKRVIRALIPAPVRERLRRIPRNLLADLRVLLEIRAGGSPIDDLARYEKSVRSQNGEDGILAAIFAAIGTTSRYFVEFGVEDGRVCNTRYLRDLGWDGLQMDMTGGPDPFVKRERITAENVNDAFKRYGVPSEFDLLSIDIDGNDYWVWKAISGYRPRAVVIECNAGIPPEEPRTIAYDSDFRWDGTDYFGAGIGALEKLGRKKGYTLIGMNSNGVNAFFVRDDLAARFVSKTAREAHRPLGAPHRPPPHSKGRDWISV